MDELTPVFVLACIRNLPPHKEKLTSSGLCLGPLAAISAYDMIAVIRKRVLNGRGC